MKLVIGIPNWQLLIKEQQARRLFEAKIEIVSNESGQMADKAFLEKHLLEADAYIAGGEEITKQLLEKAKHLKVIARYGVGTDHIDLDACKTLGIWVTTTAGANANAVAEHAVALMLAVQRQFKYYFEAVPKGKWKISEFPELSQKTIGLIGFGRIGKLVAKRLSGFDAHVLAYDPNLTAKDMMNEGVFHATLDELFRESNIISLHLPATEESYHLINEKRLRQMRCDSFLINTARGSLVDEAALYRALSEKQIAGAALDVTEQEPCSSANPLLNLPNVVITPHIAGGSYENHEKAGALCVDAVLSALEGRIPTTAIFASFGR